jgi:hypothetical protein
MAAKHIITARTQGAKAGFKQFVDYCNSPLGRNNERIEDQREAVLGAGNKKAQFAAYCELFLGEVPSPLETPDVSTLVEQLRALGVEVKLPEAPKPVRAPRTRKAAEVVSKGDKPRTWSAFWVGKKRIPTKVGATFTYKSKKYGTTSKHKVVKVNGDGSVVTQRVSIAR